MIVTRSNVEKIVYFLNPTATYLLSTDEPHSEEQGNFKSLGSAQSEIGEVKTRTNYSERRWRCYRRRSDYNTDLILHLLTILSKIIILMPSMVMFQIRRPTCESRWHDSVYEICQ